MAMNPEQEIACFEALAVRVREAPAKFADTSTVAAASGVDLDRLDALLQRHAHRRADVWLDRVRVEHAARQLRETARALPEIAAAAGYVGPRPLERAFRRFMRITPEAYRALVRPRRGARTPPRAFELHLPAAFRATEVLAFHGRDPDGVSERVTGSTVVKAVTLGDGPAVLEIELTARAARCRVHASARLHGRALAELHERALRLLGLTLDVAAFEAQAQSLARFAPLLARRRGLHMPRMADAFEALCWAIIGQQINVTFATSLRQTLVELAGTRVNGLRAPPTPEQVAALEERALTTRRYSRAKARYLIGAARAVAGGEFAIESLASGSAVAAEHALTNLYGVGTWTARYTLMRGAGFADCAPVGDVALAAALQRWQGLDARPAAAVVEALLEPFSPFRSLATGHLWASLKDNS